MPMICCRRSLWCVLDYIFHCKVRRICDWHDMYICADGR